MGSNLSQLRQLIQDHVKKIAVEEMAESVKQVESDEIEKEVYEQYSPTQYIRRKENEGLIDKNNMQVYSNETDKGINIEITNDTKGNENYKNHEVGFIDEIIEKGEGYTWENSEIANMQPYPRPFTEKTIENLQQNKQYIDVLKKEMQKLGYKIK